MIVEITLHLILLDNPKKERILERKEALMTMVRSSGRLEVILMIKRGRKDLAQKSLLFGVKVSGS